MRGLFVLGAVCPIAFLAALSILFLFGRVQIKNGGSRLLKRSFHALARKYHGHIQSHGLFRTPAVHFRHVASHVVVRAVSTGGTEALQFSFIWPDRDLRIVIGCDESGVRAAAALLPEVPVKPAGDGQSFFFVRGAPEGSVARFLSSGVQWKLNCLYHLVRKSQVDLTIRSGVFHLRKSGAYRTFPDIEELTRVALELHDQALLTRSVGIEFLGADSVLPISLAAAKCQVCGEALGADHVICRTCKTPHHHDCWNYAGCCSVFACRDTRYLIPVADASSNAEQNAPTISPFRKPR